LLSRRRLTYAATVRSRLLMLASDPAKDSWVVDLVAPPVQAASEPPGVAADLRILSQRAGRAAHILRFEANSGSSGAARLRSLKGEP